MKQLNFVTSRKLNCVANVPRNRNSSIEVEKVDQNGVNLESFILINALNDAGCAIDQAFFGRNVLEQHDSGSDGYMKVDRGQTGTLASG